MSRKLTIEPCKIRVQPIEKNWLDQLTLIEQNRSGELHRSVHRKKSVRDNFESRCSVGNYCFWAADSQPCKFHLGQCGNFGDSAQRECERIGVCCEAAVGRSVMRIIEEHFVHNQG